MSDILCIYYSRTGATRTLMRELAEALDAECVEITDGIDRSGKLGFLLCGLDAMRQGTRRLLPYKTERPLGDYRLVLLGTPIWAGRCSSIMRGFLKRHGLELSRVGYVLTRGSDNEYREVFDQMDRYTAAPRMAETSLRFDETGYHFWRDQFLKELGAVLETIGDVPPTDREIIDFVPPADTPRKRRSRKKKDEKDA